MSLYAAYGLTISVPFDCPALSPAAAGVRPDVVVTEGAVPTHLSSAQVSEGGSQASPGVFLLRGGPSRGRWLVTGGQVTLQRGAASDAVLARQFTNAVLAAVLRQRGLLVLHANAVALRSAAVVLTGESGAGKSTTARALVDDGAAMLSDDVTVVRPASLDVVPGTAQTHLTEDAAAALGVNYDDSQLQPWRRMKVAISTHERMATAPAQLAAVAVLVSGRDRSGEVVATPLDGGAKFAALQEALYGPLFAEEQRCLFGVISNLLAQVPVYRIVRPTGRWSAREVADAVRSLVPISAASA